MNYRSRGYIVQVSKSSDQERSTGCKLAQELYNTRGVLVKKTDYIGIMVLRKRISRDSNIVRMSLIQAT